MKIFCEQCGNEISAENINIQEMIAVCKHCNNISKIKTSEKSEKEKVEYSLPPGIEIYEDYSNLRIERKWFSPAAFALLFFCIFWDGFMIVWYGIAISQQQWAMAGFGIIHLLAGIGVSYLCVAMFINKTRIIVSNLDIEIESYPLPFGKKKVLSSSDFKQFYTKEKVTHGKNGTSISYELFGVSKINGKIKLLDGVETMDQVKYIEQEIEKYLNIEDEYVADEVRY